MVAVRVNPDFSIAAHPHIFVIGDAAAASGMDGKPLPGLAAVAKQEGNYVGNLIRQRVAGADPKTVFRYRDYGTMATIERSGCGRRPARLQAHRNGCLAALGLRSHLLPHRIPQQIGGVRELVLGVAYLRPRLAPDYSR